MRDIQDLIRRKEADMERIQRELQALRLSLQLLQEASTTSATDAIAAAATSTPSSSSKPLVAVPLPTTQPSRATLKQFP